MSKSEARCAGNPNIEIRNPKQIQSTKFECSKPECRTPGFGHFFLSVIRACFGFRYSDFGFSYHATTSTARATRVPHLGQNRAADDSGAWQFGRRHAKAALMGAGTRTAGRRWASMSRSLSASTARSLTLPPIVYRRCAPAASRTGNAQNAPLLEMAKPAMIQLGRRPSSSLGRGTSIMPFWVAT